MVFMNLQKLKHCIVYLWPYQYHWDQTERLRICFSHSGEADSGSLVEMSSDISSLYKMLPCMQTYFSLYVVVLRIDVWINRGLNAYQGKLRFCIRNIAEFLSSFCSFCSDNNMLIINMEEQEIKCGFTETGNSLSSCFCCAFCLIFDKKGHILCLP